MWRPLAFAPVGLALGMLGCPSGASPDVGQDTRPDAPASGTTRTYVLTSIQVPPTASGGQAPGFDLDGIVSSTPGSGCTGRFLDFIAPDGTTGIDNQFVGSVVGLVRQFVPTFSPQRALESQMQEGRLLLGLTVSGMDDAMNDPSVSVDVVVLRPASCAADRCALEEPIETIATWRTRGAPIATGVDGRIIDGRLEVVAAMLPVRFRYNELEIAMTLHQAHLTAGLSDIGLARGAFGGAVSIADTARLAEQLRSGTGALVTHALSENADIPLTAGACDGLSLGAAFQALPATVNP